MQPLVSIVIPTKNGARTIKRCLTGIAQQTHSNFEVVIVDSSSDDETVELAIQFDFVKVVSINAASFNHGLTRNLGVAHTAGDFVLMTVQDAWPADNNLLERMLAHFNDPEVVGVCGQQVVPHEADKNPHEWFRPFTKPKPRIVHFTDLSEIESLSPQELRDACGWDNVNALYRKSALISYPFPKVSFGEDMAWSKRAVYSGKKIVYDYNARVFHYHHSTYDYTYKRTLTVLYFIYKNFGFVKKVDFNMTDYIKVIFRNLRYKVSPKWIWFNWSRMKASSQAYKDILTLLKRGDNVLDKYHYEKCEIPPQGKQNIKA
jgi:rhamnosyltransferase